MKKKNMPLLWHTRRIFFLCILTLAVMGFLMEWLVYGKHFLQALTAAVLPVLPAALFSRQQKRHHFLEKGLAGIRDAAMLNMAMPVLLGSICFALYEEGICLGVWLSISFLICACISEAALYRREEECVGALLLNTVVFYGMAVFLEPHAGAAITIGALSLVLFFHLYWSHPGEKNGADFGKQFIALCAAVLFLTVLSGRVITNLLASWMQTPRSTAAGQIFMDLVLEAKWIGPARASPYPFGTAGYQHELAYLVSEFGWISLIPIALVLMVLLAAGFRLCLSFHRALTTLSVGCCFLLTVRILGYILLGVGFDPGITGGFPFFGGDFPARMLDFTMAAVLLQPLSPPALEALDPADPDFHALEVEALVQLPYNMDGLAQLCRYVYGDPEKCVAWTLLLRDYLPLMDANTRRIMILNADYLFRTDYFRSTYPEIFACAGGLKTEEIPADLRSECCNNSFLDHEAFWTASGTRLKRYHGIREKLLIPPFYRCIACEAFKENKKLTVVSVPNTVERICLSAFEDCKSLQKAELREGLKEIGPFAFAGSGLKEMTLPSGLLTIEENAFAGTSLEDVLIPGSVNEIAEGAFCEIPTLKLLVLSEGVQAVQNDAFRNCTELSEIHIPDSLTTIAPEAFSGCTGIREVHASDSWKKRYPDLLRIITGSAGTGTRPTQ